MPAPPCRTRLNGHPPPGSREEALLMAATEAFTARRPIWHYWTAALIAVLGLGAVLIVVAAVTGTGRSLPGFFGTNARLLNDLNLTLQLLMAASLVIAVVLARRGNYR